MGGLGGLVFPKSAATHCPTSRDAKKAITDVGISVGELNLKLLSELEPTGDNQPRSRAGRKTMVPRYSRDLEYEKRKIRRHHEISWHRVTW